MMLQSDWFYWLIFLAISSLQQGDLISRCCPSVCKSVCRSVCLSVLFFLTFQKESFREWYSKLSNTTKLILLDSILQKVTTGEIQIANCLIGPSLYFLIHFTKRLPCGLFMYVLIYHPPLFENSMNLVFCVPEVGLDIATLETYQCRLFVFSAANFSN